MMELEKQSAEKWKESQKEIITLLIRAKNSHQRRFSLCTDLVIQLYKPS